VLVLVTSSLSCIAVGEAEAELARAADTSVSFTAVGPGGLKIVGTTSELTVADDDRTITTRVALANLTTGIGLRDKHMREKYLEVGSYPNAELRVPRASLVFPKDAAASADAQGTMLLHGREKPVTFRYTAKRAGAKVHVEGSVHLDMREFGIAVPSYLGVTVKPDVEVVARFDAEDAS
jgi:polyisoprenoid-binding protein YceI